MLFFPFFPYSLFSSLSLLCYVLEAWSLVFILLKISYLVGGYGTVYRARRKHDGTVVAIKCKYNNLCYAIASFSLSE